MAERVYYLGTLGPYFYDDEDEVNPEEDAEDPTYNPQNLETKDTINTEGQIFVDQAPVKPHHVLRLEETSSMGFFHRVARVEGIDLKTATTPTIFTSDGSYLPAFLVIYASTISTVTVHPTLGLGIAAGEDDIFIAEMINLTASGQAYVFSMLGRTRILLDTEVVKLGVDVNASATTYLVDVELYALEIGT